MKLTKTTRLALKTWSIGLVMKNWPLAQWLKASWLPADALARPDEVDGSPEIDFNFDAAWRAGAAFGRAYPARAVRKPVLPDFLIRGQPAAIGAVTSLTIGDAWALFQKWTFSFRENPKACVFRYTFSALGGGDTIASAGREFPEQKDVTRKREERELTKIFLTEKWEKGWETLSSFFCQ